MSKGWTYKSGDWNLYCDVCGRKIKASEAKHRWDGFIVCAEDWEPRHTLDFVKSRQDKITVPFSRPSVAETFVDDSSWIDTKGCPPMGHLCLAEIASAECAIVGRTR